MIFTPYLNYSSDKVEEFAIGRREARTGDGRTAYCALVRNIKGRNNTVILDGDWRMIYQDNARMT
jgi:hypothetical protein